MTSALRITVGAMLLGTLASCSSDSDATPATLQGHWKTFLQPSGNPETGPYPTYFEQIGTVLNGIGGTGVVNGNTMVYDTVIAGLDTTFVGTYGTTNITGTFSAADGLVTGIFRMEPYTPAGSFTANGTINSEVIAVSATDAIGQRMYGDVALTQLDAVFVMHMAADTEFDLTFNNPAALTTGTLSIPGTISVDVALMDDLVSNQVTGTGGTVTVTKYDSTGFAATFTIDMGGESVTGSFDVSWDVDTYQP